MRFSAKGLMLRRWLTIPILLFVAAAGCGRPAHYQRSETAQEVPLVIERWPEEGVPVLAWKSSLDSLFYFSHPGNTKPSGRLAVQPNQQLPWDRSMILLQELGSLKILEDCDLTAYVYQHLRDGKLSGGRSQQLHFLAGTLVDVVCYAAEGDYIFRHQGRYLEMTGSDSRQQMLRPPQTQWWVRITKDGKPIGWVRVDGDNVSVVDRKF